MLCVGLHVVDVCVVMRCVVVCRGAVCCVVLSYRMLCCVVLCVVVLRWCFVGLPWRVDMYCVVTLFSCCVVLCCVRCCDV